MRFPYSSTFFLHNSALSKSDIRIEMIAGGAGSRPLCIVLERCWMPRLSGITLSRYAPRHLCSSSLLRNLLDLWNTLRYTAIQWKVSKCIHVTSCHALQHTEMVKSAKHCTRLCLDKPCAAAICASRAAIYSTFSSAQGDSSAVPVHTSRLCLYWTNNQALLDWMQRQASRLCIVFSSANPGQPALSSTAPQSRLHS